jgi:hypothetical protein
MAQFEEQHEPQEQSTPDLRALLSANIDAAEAATKASTEAPEQDDAAAAAVRKRDEHGRFAAGNAEQQDQPPPAAAPPTEATAKPSLTTWRKEYLPIQQKLEAGIALTADEAKKLADYNVQREREYSTGISTYKAEAQQAKAIQDVMQEFMPALQHHNMQPAQWIQNMGRTHQQLVYGTPEQKLGIFASLMQTYGIPADGLFQAMQGQINPNTLQSMQAQQQHETALRDLQQWRQQMENQAVQQQLSRFADATRYPHFEQVRGEMARLLETGFAQDPDSAYDLAVRINADAWAAEQQRQAAATAAAETAKRAAAASKARLAGGSMRSGTAAVAATAQPPDIRHALESAFEQHAGPGRV